MDGQTLYIRHLLFYTIDLIICTLILLRNLVFLSLPNSRATRRKIIQVPCLHRYSFVKYCLTEWYKRHQLKRSRLFCIVRTAHTKYLSLHVPRSNILPTQ